MKIDPAWKALGLLFAAGTLLLVLVNMNWSARNLFAEFGWELSAQVIYAASMVVPLALGIIIGQRIKSSALAWTVGIAVFLGSGVLGIYLIDDAPGQIKWRIEAMRDSSTDYDGSRP